MQSHHANHTPPALDGADSYAKVTAGAHAGAYGANDQKTPSEATAKRGNYKMGRVTVQGLRIAIEQPCGSIRSGKSEDGKEWSSRMAAHYGYFMGTQGADGDGIDCFVGPHPESEQVFVVNQRNPGGGFDEHKVMLAFSSERHAQGAYLDSYERGWRGLQSLVPISLDQLRWWIKHGKKSIALTAESLPQQGTNPMNPKITWTEAQPDSISLDQVLYQLRRMDGADGLLLDSVTMAEIMEDTDGVIALDALVVENAQLARMAERLRAIMDRSGGTVKAPAVQVSEPFRARGVTNIATVFELSDGQTVSVFFHNPDTAPNKLAPGDEMISWKWLLNKKDITIVVAPEKGQDLNPRLVASRIMKLAEKNSPAFQKANAKRSERMGNIEAIRGRIAEKEATLTELVAQVEAARLEKDQREGSITSIKDAIKIALANTDGIVETPDHLSWALSKSSLNKMVAGTNSDGQKPYQKERILAIQKIQEIASHANPPLVRKDDRNVPEIDAIYEYFSTFSVDGVTYKVRLLCKKFKDTSPVADKMHSMKLDGVSADQISPNGLLFSLEIVDVAELGDPDLSLPPSAESEVIVSKINATGQVDAAYQFATATDAFKERVAGSIDKADYSEFATAKAMDMKAKELGAEIHWGMGAALDAVQAEEGSDEGEGGEEDDFDPEAEFDACPVEELEPAL